MKKVTTLRTGKGKGKGVDIFLDGNPAFSLKPKTEIKESHQAEQTPSKNQVELPAKPVDFPRCLKAAVRYLSYRPRSEFELRERLKKRSFDTNTLEAVISKLREQRLVNDIAFAEFWIDNRATFSPRSQRLTRLELRKKGIADDIIEQAINSIDDAESSYQAAQSKARSIPRSDYQVFRRRLGEYLKRRGFSYEVTSQTINRLWQEPVD